MTREALPLWIRILLTLFPAVQWGIAARFSVLAQSMGISFLGPALFASVVGLSVVALVGWLAPASPLVRWGYRLLKSLGRQRLAFVLPLTLLALAVVLYARSQIYTFLALQLVLGAGLLTFASPAAFATLDSKWLAVAPLAIIALGLGLRLWLMRVDFVWVDEGFHLNAADNMLGGGPIAPAVMNFADDVSVPPWRGYAFKVYHLWASLFGIGLAQGRTLAYVVGLLALPFIYTASRLWYGKRAALVTLSIVSLNYLFLQSTMARTDSLPMLAVSIVLAGHVFASQRDQPAWHLPVGLLATLALETHYVNVLFIAVFGVYYIVDHVRAARRTGSWLRPSPLLFYAVGILVGMAVYYLLHIAPYGLKNFAAATAPISRVEGSYQLSYLATIIAKPGLWWRAAPLTLLVVLACAIAAFVRRNAVDNHWLMLAAFTGLALLVFPTRPIPHGIYGLPIFLAASGALVTSGTKTQDQPGSPWERLAFATVVAVMAVHAAIVIREHSQSRVTFDALRLPAVTYVRDNVPPDRPIISEPDYYPDLIELGYTAFIHPDYAGPARGYLLHGLQPEAFWLETLLDSWPVARTAPDDKHFAMYESYMASRHAHEVAPALWLASDGDLVTDAAYARIDSDPALQMVAHVRLPESIEPETELVLNSIWVSRQPIDEDYAASLSLVGEDGVIAEQTDSPIVSGWAGTPTSMWSAWEFHDIALSVMVPGALKKGSYSLRINLLPTPPETDSSLGEEMACHPNCSFSVVDITVEP